MTAADGWTHGILRDACVDACLMAGHGLVSGCAKLTNEVQIYICKLTNMMS